MSLVLAALLQSALESPAPAMRCDAPVNMVVAGDTLDRARMIAYGQAIAQSEVYNRLGGYYVTMPQTIEVFEGDASPDYVVLIVRFPCIENARAFWNSRVYQEDILPLRQKPSAGNYIVSVHAEATPPAYMADKLAPGRYLHDYADHDEPQYDRASQ